jgi:hypothetical protein
MQPILLNNRRLLCLADGHPGYPFPNNLQLVAG